MKTPKIIWPIWAPDGRTKIKDGTIDGVPFAEIWEECQNAGLVN